MKKMLSLLLLAMFAYSGSTADARYDCQKKSRTLKYDREAFFYNFQPMSDNATNYQLSKESFKKQFKNPHPANYYFAKAKEAMAANTPVYAIQYADSAIAAFTRRAYVTLPMLHDVKLRAQLQRDPDQALATLNNYLNANPTTNPYAYIMRGDLYSKNKESRAALADYRKTLELCDTIKGGHMGVAKELMAQGRNPEALEVLDAFEGRFAGYAPMYKLRSNLYQTIGSGKLAVDDMIKYIDYNSWFSAGDFITVLEANSDYVSQCMLDRTKDGNDAQFANWLRVQSYILAGRYIDAVEPTERLAKEDTRYFATLGLCYHYLGLGEYAIKAYEKFLEQYGGEYNYGQVGDACRDAGQFQKAMSYYNRAYELEPTDFYYHGARGNVSLMTGDTLSAIRFYSAALELNPNDSLSMFFRGVVYREMGRQELANADFNKFIKLNPTKRLHLVVATVHAYLGNNQRAIQLCDSLLEARPFDHDVQYGAACMYSFMDNKPKALYHLRKAFECGYRKFVYANWDFDLKNIRKEPEFQAIIEEYKNKPLYIPTITF